MSEIAKFPSAITASVAPVRSSGARGRRRARQDAPNSINRAAAAGTTIAKERQSADRPRRSLAVEPPRNDCARDRPADGVPRLFPE